jgi:heme/copper-type cytochrome/quinol oxidase subunit 2
MSALIAWLLANKWTRWLGIVLLALGALWVFLWRIRKDAVDDEHARQAESTLEKVKTVEQIQRETDGLSDDQAREKLKGWSR